jgi:hypothetical protein
LVLAVEHLVVEALLVVVHMVMVEADGEMELMAKAIMGVSVLDSGIQQAAEVLEDLAIQIQQLVELEFKMTYLEQIIFGQAVAEDLDTQTLEAMEDLEAEVLVPLEQHLVVLD